MNNLIFGLFFSLIFLIVLIILEYLARRYKLETELTRKTAHVLSCFFAILMSRILNMEYFILFVLLFFIVICISYFFKFFSSIHNVKRKTFGELLLPLGILVGYILSNGSLNNFFCSMLILGIGDPLAGFIRGKVQFGLYYSPLVLFIFSFVVLFIFFNSAPVISLLFISLIVVAAEYFFTFGIDNLILPFAVGLMIRLLL